MGRLVKTFMDGSFLEYDRGKIDNWCVYMTDQSGVRKPPFDIDYFREVKVFAEKYGVDRIYNDFVFMYDRTTRTIDVIVLVQITKLANQYETEDSLNVEKLYTTLYMAMTSEENYPRTKLGRKIKRLGIYEMLYGGRKPEDAARFMTGMEWRDIATLCQERGF